MEGSLLRVIFIINHDDNDSHLIFTSGRDSFGRACQAAAIMRPSPSSAPAPLRQASSELTLQTPGPGLHEFTREASAWVAQQGMDSGLLTVFCRHTSASLCIQENAAREVHGDVLRWLDRMAPENDSYAHDDEGPDDMPAHLKSILTGVSLSIPLIDGRLALGTWQGLYLCEHRRRAHRRHVVLHLLGA
jgi:secondary thiamine-phosphate synthase enzyme